MPTRKGTTGTSPVGWKGLGTCLLLGGSGAFYVHLEREKVKIATEKKNTKAAGAAAIGGPFKMHDLEGKEFTEQNLLGQWTLLYFGFTFCPDICPEELDKMSEALDILDENKKLPTVQPIFISIDPDRDTPEKLKVYLEDFHPRMFALTGTNEETKATAKTYRVYYSRPEPDGSDDYLVDHTIIMYLISPSGEFVQHYGQLMTPQEMAAGIAKKILSYSE